MRYCTACRKKNFYPQSIAVRIGICEICGMRLTVFDTPRKILDKVKPPQKFADQKPRFPCKDCPSYYWPVVRIIPETINPRKNRRADFLFIGEAPGRLELKKGKAFVGKAGRLFRNLFLEANIAKRFSVITNSALCSVGGGPMEKPPQEAFDLCTFNLAGVFAQYNPRVVVPLGAYAIRAVATLFPDLRNEMCEIASGLQVGKLDGQIFNMINTGNSSLVRWQNPKHKNKSATFAPMYHPSFFQKPGNEAKRPFAVRKWKRLSTLIGR